MKKSVKIEETGNPANGLSEKLTITWMARSFEGGGWPDDHPMIRALNQKFNVDMRIEWVPADIYKEKMAVLSASNDFPDLFFLQYPDFNRWKKTGLFLDIQPLLDQYPNLAGIPASALKALHTRGQIFGLPFYVTQDRDTLTVREDWLEKLGIAVPATLDEFYAVAKAFAEKDPDGNGKPDTVGFTFYVDHNAAFRDIEFILANSSYYTPNLDKLVERGVRFTGAISTSAQCSPSRATWMTGKHPHQVGVNNIGHVLDPQDWGIAKSFNQAGYETVYLGKWHLGLSPADHEFRITDYRTDGFELGAANPNPRYHSHKDAVTTAKALNYLEDYDGSKPFFMAVNWFMLHPNVPADGPFERIEPYAEQFPQEAMPVPGSYYTDDLSSKPAFQLERSLTGESKLTEELVRRDAQHYRSMLKLMDESLGRIMEKLEAKGLLDCTTILFTTDHGDMQGAHKLRLKGVLPYKELYNVPLILYVPWANPARKVIPDLVSSAAVTGTLLDVAGIGVPAECEGGSLMPHLAMAVPPAGQLVFFEHYKAYWGYHPFRGAQTPEWKYVYYYEEDMEEMYNLQQDPDELVNVAGRPEAEDARRTLRQAVDAWWETTGALSKPVIQDTVNKWGEG